MRAVNYFLALRAFCEKHRSPEVASFHVRASVRACRAGECTVNKFKSSLLRVIDKSKLHDTSRLRGLKGTVYISSAFSVAAPAGALQILYEIKNDDRDMRRGVTGWGGGFRSLLGRVMVPLMASGLK